MTKNKRNILWRGIYILFIFIGVGGSVFIFNLKTTPEKPLAFPTVVKKEIGVPTKAVAVIVDKTQYKLNILNGNGVTGRAAEVKEILENEGFVVNTIGNADKPTYSKSIIRANKKVDPMFTVVLEKVLDIYYPSYIEEDNSFPGTEITIIIGKDTATNFITP